MPATNTIHLARDRRAAWETAVIQHPHIVSKLSCHRNLFILMAETHENFRANIESWKKRQVVGQEMRQRGF